LKKRDTLGELREEMIYVKAGSQNMDPIQLNYGENVDDFSGSIRG
jgi:hypothetical protein